MLSRFVGTIDDLTFDEEFDEPWALAFDPNQPRDPEGTTTGGQWTVKFPGSIKDLTFKSDLGGSTGAKLYVDAKGKKWVFKKGKSPEHVKNEYEANYLYHQLGVRVPAAKLYHGPEGTYMLTRYVDGVTLSEHEEQYGNSSDEYKAAVKAIQKDFVKDALLGNWDVVGLTGDNIIIDEDGNPWRIDNGGALAFRAQGAPKGSAWNAAVGETDTMRAPSNSAGKVFGGMTNAEVQKQVKALVDEHTTTLVGKVDDDMIFKRFTTLVGKYGGDDVAEEATKVAKKVATPAKAAAVAAVNASWLGKTKVDALNQLSYKLKLVDANHTLTDKDMKKMVMMAINNNDDKSLAILSTLSPDEVAVVQKAFPDKKLYKVTPAKVLEEQFATTGAKTFPQLWIKAFNEPASQPLPHPSLKKDAKKFDPDDVADSPFTEKEKKLGGGVKTYVSKLYWEAYAEQYAEEFANDPIYSKKPLVSDAELHAKAIEKGNGQYGDVVKEAFKKGDHGAAINAAGDWGGSPTSIHQAELGHKDADNIYKKYAAAIQKAWKDPTVPKYKGIAYRGMHGVKPGTHSFEQLTTPGNIVEFNASQGATRKATLGFVNNFVLRCAVKSGVSIESMTGHGSELEMWLPAGSRWRVAAVAYNVVLHGKTIKTLVDIEEVTK